MRLLIKGGHIFDAIQEEPYIADILIEDGKIKKIEKNITMDGEVELISAIGLNVYPGLVEAHGHIGLDGYGIGFEGQDYNELNDILTPHLRAIDGINPLDETFIKLHLVV